MRYRRPPLPAAIDPHCVRALYRDVPDDVPLVAAELVTLELTTEHKSTGHLPGQHAALVMPVYASTVAKLLELPPCVLLEQGKRIKVALDYMHSRHYVHMDVKVRHARGFQVAPCKLVWACCELCLSELSLSIPVMQCRAH